MRLVRVVLFRAAVVLSVAAAVAGAVSAAVANDAGADGPAAVVRGYFDALARGDAAAALGYGTIDGTAGSARLLTSAVLREQQRIAPIRAVSVSSVRTVPSGAGPSGAGPSGAGALPSGVGALASGAVPSGAGALPSGVAGRTRAAGPERAIVQARYTLAYPGLPFDRTVRLALTRVDGRWRLDDPVVATRLSLSAARQRSTLLGGTVPSGRVLLFPGAVPLRFDSAYLQLSPTRSDVYPGVGDTAYIDVEVSAAGRRAAGAAMLAALRTCLDGRAADESSCPVTDERAVPGTLRGSLTGGLRRPSVVLVDGGDAIATGAAGGVGEVELSGSAPVQGSYRHVGFTGSVGPARVRGLLSLQARCILHDPITIQWRAA